MSGRFFVDIGVKARERRHSFSLSPRSKRNLAFFSGTSTRYSPVQQPVQMMMHGYKSSAERDFCGGLQIAVQGGFYVLLVDQRAHG